MTIKMSLMFFRKLPQFIPFVPNVRLGDGGRIVAALEYDDTSISVDDRKPDEVYLLEKILVYQDVDTAVRGFNHIKKRYAPQVGDYTIHVRNVTQALQDVSYALQEAGVTEQDIAGMSEEMAQEFINSKFANSHSPEVIDVMHQTFKALSKDIKGRVNTSRSRLMIAHLKPDLARLMFKGRRIHEKNAKTYLGIVQERAFELRNLQFAKEVLEHAASLTVGDGAFEREEMAILKRIYSALSPSVILVRPYAPLAAEIRFLLFANDRQAKDEITDKTAVDKLSEYVGTEKAENLARSKTYKEMDDPMERKKRLKLITGNLERLMHMSEKRVNYSFDDLLFDDEYMSNLQSEPEMF